jgi:hypothetical protein
VTLALRLLLPLLLLTSVCVSVLSHDWERDAQAVSGVAPGASAHGAPLPRLAGALRAVNRPFESWAPAGSGETAAVSMRVITLGLRN